MSLLHLVILFTIAAIGLFVWQLVSAQRSLFEVRSPFGGVIPPAYRVLYICAVIAVICSLKLFGII